MKDILKTLIEFPTVSHNYDANHQALEYVDRFLSERGLYVKRLECGGHESLIATTKHTKTPRIMLGAHLDVIPAPPRLFKLKEKNGKLYGRGVCDMKFAIAAYLQAVDDFQEDLHLYDFGIMITTDEEIGGRDGVKSLLDEGYRPEACVLPDGGDNWILEQSAKGVIWLAVTATGKTAHGSRPWEGESAIEKMLLFLQAMQRELFSEQNAHTNTCNIGIIHGGNAFNQIADYCTSDVDIRFTNREQHQHILGRIEELSKTYDVSYELRVNDSAINIDLGNPFVVAFARSIEAITGGPFQTMRSNAASDARYFAEYDIPTLVTYPPGGGRHSDEEWIEEESFYTFKDLVCDYLSRTAKIKPLTDPTLSKKSLTSTP